jgi:tetratricopeptide (TPR) repeat protein
MSDDQRVDTELKAQLLEGGHVSFDSGDYTRALDLYHRVSLLDKSDSAIWTSLGLTFNNLDFPREAWRSYLLALNLDPRNTDALWYAAEFLFQIEDLPLADLFLGHYLALEQDVDKVAEARELREEIHTEAKARGVTLEQARGEVAASMLEGGDSAVSEQIGAETDAEDVPVEESADWQLSEDELEQMALQGGRFTPPLQLRLSGFEAGCQHCGLQIPFDAPYCWSCKMIHFYD